jgi:hypothetical protein
MIASACIIAYADGYSHELPPISLLIMCCLFGYCSANGMSTPSFRNQPNPPDAIIKIPDCRKNLPLIAAATNQGKVRFMIYAGGSRRSG